MTEGRTELKYALPGHRRAAVLAAAAGHVVPDDNGEPLDQWMPSLRRPGGGPAIGYRVSSLYLDDARLDGYAQRVADLHVRNRVRIRTYGSVGDVAPVFLEAKRKLRARVVKHRVRVGNTADWAQLPGPRPWQHCAALASPVARHLVDRWVGAVDDRDLQVIHRVEYLRETYTQGSARLTLDHRVSAEPITDPFALRGPTTVPLLPPDWFVLELKYDGHKPLWMRSLVQALRLAAEPVSKFALGVALAVRPDCIRDARRFLPPSVQRHAAEAAR